MNTIGSVSPVSGFSYSTSDPTSQGATAATTSGATSPTEAAGLPPVNLAQAATQNTINAGLVCGLLGVDPGTVSGVYGGAASTGDNPFSGLFALPILNELSSSNAEQALSLLGFQVPTSATGSSAPAAATDAAPSSANMVDA